MGRHGPGPVYVGDAGRPWWLALFGKRKNKSKAKPQGIKGWGKGGNKPPHRGGKGKKKGKGK